MEYIRYNARKLSMEKVVRTRIAPSPTGEDIHVGNLYTAYLSYIYAKKHNGQFIVRIEDTDRERLVPGSEQRIIKTLHEYGIEEDESPEKEGPFSPYRQSDRLAIYKEYVGKLIENKTAYYCTCSKERLEELRSAQISTKKTPRYDKHCLSRQEEVIQEIEKGADYVIRMDIHKDQEITFTDVVRGEITFNSNDLDDQVLLKSDGFPTYHLAVVIDDHLMEITHIIRAEDWISSTPKHILLYKAFGWDLPVFCHVPILRNPDKTKLSKRKNPVWAHWYLEQGFLPEAMLNFLILMGWSHPDEKEIFPQSEFIKYFELSDIRAVGPAFDVVKLKWMNQQYIMALTDDELKQHLLEFLPYLREKTNLEKLLPLVKTRMEVLGDFPALAAHFYTFSCPVVREAKEKEVAHFLIEAFEKIAEWNPETILALFKESLTQYGIRMPVLYYILTGEEKGLPLPESVEILGKEETLSRLKRFYDQ